MRRRSSVPLTIVVFALASALASCGEEEVPLQPRFEPTIRLLFAAHCVRCHGAGGTLNQDPGSILGPPDAPTTYLDRYADSGDCTFDPVTMSVPASCKVGAHSNAGSIKLFAVVAKDTELMRMPPAPSDPLTDWEKELLGRWCDNPLP